mmetsp:Transcript_108250/g.305103  ORF Transcript_108250/g.305103 Transcript_108250/m.305103 type:complete len:448 (-) Transcript_108250:105-1448(-)
MPHPKPAPKVDGEAGANNDGIATAATRALEAVLQPLPLPCAPPRPTADDGSLDENDVGRAKSGNRFGDRPTLTLWNLIIRPRRSAYVLDDLGPPAFTIGSRACMRVDVVVKTSRGLSLECSHFRPRSEDVCRRMPVLVYLHGSSGCRLEALDLVPRFLRAGITLFCYDAAACGMSDGEYVSMGWYERDDLRDVIAHIRTKTCAPIALWGRSMGAVTALLYGTEDQSSIAAMVVDSPFSNLKELVLELAHGQHVRRVIGFQLPYWLVDATFAFVRLRVQALAQFDMEELGPLHCMKEAVVPVRFVHGASDTFIPAAHSRRLCEAYGGTDKAFVEVDGTHNSKRDTATQKKLVAFLVEALKEHRAKRESLGELDFSALPEDFSVSAMEEGRPQVPLTSKCHMTAAPAPELSKRSHWSLNQVSQHGLDWEEVCCVERAQILRAGVPRHTV